MKTTQQAEAEILAAIVFYRKHGWDWLDVVTYLSMKATGFWPLPQREEKRGRKRQPTTASPTPI